MNNLKNEIKTGVKWTTLGTIVVALVALLKLSILARFLDKSDFGLMALVTFVMGFMNLFSDMGITSAVLHKQNIDKREYASLYWLNIIFSAALYLLLLLITPLISNFYDQPELNILIPLLGLNLLISAVGRLFKTIESKHLLFKQVTIFEIISNSASLGFAIYLAANGYGVYSLVYSALLQYGLQNLLYFILGLKKYGLKLHFSFKETRPFLRIGIYQVGGQIINYFNKDIDILLIGKFFNAEILGGYSLAKQLVFRPAQVLNPILIKVASPALARMQSDLKSLKTSYLRLISIVAKINIAVYAFTAIFAFWIVKILYGPELVELTGLVQILCIYMVFRAIGNPIGSLVIATGKTHLEFLWNLATLIILPVFIFIGAQYSVEAVAWSLNGAMILLFYPGWRMLVFKMTGAGFREYLWAIVKPSLK